MNINTTITALPLSQIPNNERSKKKQKITPSPSHPLLTLPKVLFVQIVEFAVPNGSNYCELFQYKEGGILGRVSNRLPMQRHELLIELLKRDSSKIAAIINRGHNRFTQFIKLYPGVIQAIQPYIHHLNCDNLKLDDTTVILNHFPKIVTINGLHIVWSIKRSIMYKTLEEEMENKKSIVARIAPLLEQIELAGDNANDSSLKKMLMYFPKLKSIRLFHERTNVTITLLNRLFPQLEECNLSPTSNIKSVISNIFELKNLKKLNIPVLESRLSESISSLGNLEILELDFHIPIPPDFFVPFDSLKQLSSLSLTRSNGFEVNGTKPIDQSPIFGRLTTLNIDLQLSMDQLQSLLPQLFSLEILHFEDSPTMNIFISIVQAMNATASNPLKQLTHLQLDGSIIEQDCPLTALESCTMIRTLHVGLTNDAHQWLRRMPHLTSLRVRIMTPDDQPAKIVETISKLSHLQSLDLHLGWTAPDSIVPLLQRFAQLQSLREFILVPPDESNTKVSVENMKTIFNEKNFQSLEFITINTPLQGNPNLIRLLRPAPGKKIFVPRLRQQLFNVELMNTCIETVDDEMGEEGDCNVD